MAGFLDTNLIIRHLTQDNPSQSQKARHVFKKLESGELTLTTSEAVIVEAVQVLSSKQLYHLPRGDIKTYLTAIISLRGLKIPHKRTLLHALELYSMLNVDFVDALTIAHMGRLKTKTIWSFDRDFDRVKGIVRKES